MTTNKILLTLLLSALGMPALAADPAQSAMANDPTWPYTPQVAPGIVLNQGPESQAALDSDPTWPGGVLAGGTVLDQTVLTDDPLQGNSALAGAYYASRSDEAGTRGTVRVASCTCAHG